MGLFEIDPAMLNQAKIKVIGVGGGGGNAVNTMITSGVEGVDFVAANTDAQVLEASLAGTKLQLGAAVTKGLGAGGNPEIGRAAALEARDQIAETLRGADMVFVAAGMGGGTGTGAAPVIASVAREVGALTVAVVTKPFIFEWRLRMRKAEEGIKLLADCVDTLLVIPNQRLLQLAGDQSALDGFRIVDEVLLNAVRGICDIIIVPGLINVDFADVRTIMQSRGRALMGTGRGSGDKRAAEAAQAAITSPLLEDVAIDGATGILINITGSPDLKLAEIHEACSLINAAVSEECQCIFGSVFSSNMKDEVRITVIATGFEGNPVGRKMPPPAPPQRRTQMALHYADEVEARARAVASPAAAAPHTAEADALDEGTHLDIPAWQRRQGS
jgi:cell division protein FtsZ